MSQTMATIERKINALGLTESSVQPTGRSDAEAELAGTASGRRRPRAREAVSADAGGAGVGRSEGRSLPLAAKKRSPNMAAFLPLEHQAGPDRSAGRPARLVPGLAQRHRTRHRHPRRQRHARDSLTSSANGWETRFRADPASRQVLRGLHRANIGNRAAIVVDGQVISAPTIQSNISDSGGITGAATQEEAADLALNLRAGSLPAGVVI